MVGGSLGTEKAGLPPVACMFPRSQEVGIWKHAGKGKTQLAQLGFKL